MVGCWSARSPTTEAMRERAEDAINRAYDVEGLKRPKKIIWTRSPLEGTRKCIELGDGPDGLLNAPGMGLTMRAGSAFMSS
ncbi:MAG: hypothetical protein HC883_00490 [Bdellovibrionaceae bacterium]|nr:hypothetical protein [Pseudobdellovibrionaceae bacterium]